MITTQKKFPADLVTFTEALMENFIFCAVGKRVKLANSILLIRTCNDSQYLLRNFIVFHQRITKVKGGGQGHLVAEVDATSKGYLAEIVDQR